MTLRKIDGYALDCILEEQVAYDAEVTEYPIESGGKASDHVENATPVVTMSFVISDTPTGEVAAVRSANAVPSSEAKRFLLDLRASKRPFTVEGTTGTYPLMVFKSLTESRDKDTGDALVIEAEFRQLRLEEVRREVVDGPVNLGHRPSRSVNTGARRWAWHCPDRLIRDTDAANLQAQCLKVEVSGKPRTLRYVATGKALTKAQREDFLAQQNAPETDLTGQRSSLGYDSSTGTYVERKYKLNTETGELDITSQPLSHDDPRWKQLQQIDDAPTASAASAADGGDGTGSILRAGGRQF